MLGSVALILQKTVRSVSFFPLLLILQPAPTFPRGILGRTPARTGTRLLGEHLTKGDSSLDPELLAHIGRTSERQTELVTRRDIRKYSVATGQRAARFLAGDEAPPTFHVALFWPVVPLDQLAPDGVAHDPMFPRVPGKRPMAGGLEIEYQRPIRPGDVLTATRTLANIREKRGSSGHLVFIEVVMRVVNDQGEPVLTEKATRIYR